MEQVAELLSTEPVSRNKFMLAQLHDFFITNEFFKKATRKYSIDALNSLYRNLMYEEG